MRRATTITTTAQATNVRFSSFGVFHWLREWEWVTDRMRVLFYNSIYCIFCISFVVAAQLSKRLSGPLAVDPHFNVIAVAAVLSEPKRRARSWNNRCFCSSVDFARWIRLDFVSIFNFIEEWSEMRHQWSQKKTKQNTNLGHTRSRCNKTFFLSSVNSLSLVAGAAHSHHLSHQLEE